MWGGVGGNGSGGGSGGHCGTGGDVVIGALASLDTVVEYLALV
jgi:hypothetical protein